MTAEEFHQQQLERRQQEEEAEWRELMDSEHYKVWSRTLRSISEQEQSNQEQNKCKA